MTESIAPARDDRAWQEQSPVMIFAVPVGRKLETPLRSFFLTPATRYSTIGYD